MRSLQSRLRELVESSEYQKDFKDLKKSILGRPVIPDTEIPPLKVIQPLLKKGRINDRLIMIPNVYSEFKLKYRLEHFFDPTRPYREDFDPFQNSPISIFFGAEVLGFPDAIPDDGTRILMAVDITYPRKVLEKRFKDIIIPYKWERKERYPDDEIYRVRKLEREKMNAIEITRLKFPEFDPMNNYVLNPKERRNLKDYEAWAYYQKVRRLLKKGKTRKA